MPPIVDVTDPKRIWQDKKYTILGSLFLGLAWILGVYPISVYERQFTILENRTLEYFDAVKDKNIANLQWKLILRDYSAEPQQFNAEMYYNGMADYTNALMNFEYAISKLDPEKDHQAADEDQKEKTNKLFTIGSTGDTAELRKLFNDAQIYFEAIRMKENQEQPVTRGWTAKQNYEKWIEVWKWVQVCLIALGTLLVTWGTTVDYLRPKASKPAPRNL